MKDTMVPTDYRVVFCTKDLLNVPPTFGLKASLPPWFISNESLQHKGILQIIDENKMD